MSDYVSKESLLEALPIFERTKVTVGYIKRKLIRLPEADVAKVILCKNCKFAKKKTSGLFCEKFLVLQREDFFCADGTLKDDDLQKAFTEVTGYG